MDFARQNPQSIVPKFLTRQCKCLNERNQRIQDMSSGLLDQPSTRKCFQTGAEPRNISPPLPLLSFDETRINCINVLINQVRTLWETKRETKIVAKDDGVLPSRPPLSPPPRKGWNVDWNEASLVSVFILLSSIFRRQINVALLEKL